MSIKQLNVVFHGTFLFWKQEKGGYEVLIPSVAMHAYYAGNWEHGKLEWLDVGTYTLTNVEDGQGACFCEDDNVKFDEVPNAAAPGLRRIMLPPPRDIKTLQRLELQKNFGGPPPLLQELQKDGRIKVPRKSLGLIHVFTYDVKGKEPTLGGSHWKPANREVANLHFFADPPSRVSMKGMTTVRHPEKAFKALMSLMPSTFSAMKRFEFRYPANEIPLIEPDKDDDIPKGLRKIELVSLAVSNLLDESQIASHGVMARGRMPMAGQADGAKARANGMPKMTMNLVDVGCQPNYNCSSGCTKC